MWREVLVYVIWATFIQSSNASVTSRCSIQACPSCSNTVCNNLACHHDGECSYGTNSGGNISSCSCICETGFDGRSCESNSMETTYYTIRNTIPLNLSDAEQFINDTMDIYDDQDLRNETYIPRSLYYMIFIGEEIVTNLDENPNYSISQLNLQDFSKGMTLMMVYFLEGIERFGCMVATENCTYINTTDGNDLTARSEIVMIKTSNLLLKSTIHDDHSVQSIEQGNISITAIISKGNSLSTSYSADFGSLTLPYWETFQSKIGRRSINLNVMTFKSSPYVHLDNLDDSLTGNKLNTSSLHYNYENTAPVVRLSATGDKGDFMELDDRDDPIEVGIDMSKIYGNDDNFAPLEALNGDEGKFLLSIDINDTNLEAYMVEFKVGTKKDCEIWAKYGNNKVPDGDNYDIYIQTRGTGRIRRTRPRDLSVYFRESKLKVTIDNTNKGRRKAIDPMAFVLRCEDDYFKRRRRKKRQTVSQRHKYRLSSIGGRCLNSERTAWLTTFNNKCVKIYKAKANELIFKSTFFGTFSAQAFFIAPTPIRFDEIFLNFEERLAEAPHVLATFIVVIIVGFLSVIPLRRADRNDKMDWTYLPLLDNPEHGNKFYISVQTSTGSVKRFSSNVYIELVGTIGRSGARILSDGLRENFRRGTSSHFLLVLGKSIGDLKKVLVWHDNSGGSPRWLLAKLLILDGLHMKRHVFVCNKWFSLDCEDGRTWRRLYKTCTDTLDNQLMFEESSKRKFYDDFLLLSIFKRPYYSEFTRVQRMWTMIGMMFLAMLASAMWYELSQGMDTNSFGKLNVGPFTLSYQQLYVGTMSSVITLLPSLIVVAIFKHRKVKQSQSNFKDTQAPNETEIKPKCNDENQYTVLLENQNNSKVNASDKSKEETDGVLKAIRFQTFTTTEMTDLKRFALPWWSIFIAYGLLIICILIGGVLTFFYSLQFGKEKTNNWFLSFIFGTTGSTFVIEPVKAIMVAALIVCCLRKSAEKGIQDCPSPQNETYIQHATRADYSIYPCPSQKGEDLEVKIQRRRAQLDRQLTELLRSWLIKALYVSLVLLLGSHNYMTTSFYQNSQLLQSINSSYEATSIGDIWTWMQQYYIPGIWTNLNAAEKVRSAYEQRFLNDLYSYRLGLTRLRQVRVQENCSAPPIMAKNVKICKSEYNKDAEANKDFCPGWTSYNASCFEYDNNDFEANEEVDAAFLYHNSTSTSSFPFVGKFAVYSGGGYIINLGPKQSLALTYAQNLSTLNWIDQYTRAVFIDTNSFNPATRLFSHTQIVFELSEYGGIAWSFRAFSSNLYPYVNIIDYLVLAIQLIFCVVIISKFISILFELYKRKLGCLKRFAFYCDLADLILCLTAAISYVLRILYTVEAIEEIRNNEGLYVSLEGVEIYDELYVKSVAGVSFLAILRLLEPLTFNFYLFVLQRSLSIARYTLMQYLAVVIVVVTAFGSYLCLSVGSEVKEFRNMSTSFVTLINLLLSMVSFRGNLEMQTLQSRVVVALYSIAMSLIMVNVFITSLTIVFDQIKKAQFDTYLTNEEEEDNIFDDELNKHFWMRVNAFITSCLRRCFPNRTIRRKSELEKYLAEINKLLNKFQAVLKRRVCGEKSSFELLMKYAAKLEENWRRNRTLLERVVSRTDTNTQYSFLHPEDHLLKVTVTIPLQYFHIEFSCYEIERGHTTKIVPTTYDMKSHLYQFVMNEELHLNTNIFLQIHDTDCNEQEQNVIFSSNKENWQCTCTEQQNTDGFSMKEIPRYIFATKSILRPLRPSRPCKDSIVPGKTEHNIKKQKHISSNVKYEKHTISPDGSVIRLRSDPRVEVVFEPFSVETDVEIEIGRSLVQNNVRIHLLPKGIITKPVRLSLPYGDGDQTVRNTGSLLILLRNSDSDWTTVNSVLTNLNGTFSFKIKNFQERQAIEVFVKQSEMIWVEFPLDARDCRILKTLNMVSRYHHVASEWKKIAERLGIGYDPSRNGEDLRLTPTDDKNLPLCQEEKCFFVLYRWYRQHPEIDISDVQQLVSDMGFKHAAEYVT